MLFSLGTRIQAKSVWTQRKESRLAPVRGGANSSSGVGCSFEIEWDTDTSLRHKYAAIAKKLYRPHNAQASLDDEARYHILEEGDNRSKATQDAERSGGTLDLADLIGRCPDMCPETERYKRSGAGAEGDRDYNWLESVELVPMERPTFDPHIAVKKYPKSSADRQDLEIHIRPEPVLRFTMLHLCKTIGNVLQSEDRRYLNNRKVAEDDWYVAL